MKPLRFALAAGLLIAAAVVLAGGGSARPGLPEGGMAKKRTVSADTAGFDKQHGPHSAYECTVTGGGPNTNLDCDDPYPNNEPDIEVDPANPQHMVASSNDYGSCCDQYYTSLDGGTNWLTGNMSIEKPLKTGSDPVTVYDRKTGNVLHASLSYTVQHAAGTQACDGDLVVSISRDAGLTWDLPVLVDDGIGCDLSKTQLFNDKEWIVTDNNPSSPHYGRTYVTWSKFESHDGAYASSGIYESHSDDGGESWSTGQAISGSNASLCTYQVSGPTGVCDENQFSVPTVGADGTVYVAFQNEQNTSLWTAPGAFDNQYLLVKSSDGGATWSSPTFVVGLQDGTNDYPINVRGRQTLTGYQLRVNSAGNIVANHVDGALYLVFADNRDGVHNSAAPVTNTNVYVMKSSTGGTTWGVPSLVDAGGGDQWFPWVEVNPTNGKLGILYNDRGAANGATYNATLAEGLPGSFTKTIVSAAPSNPTSSIFFKARVAGCYDCAVFHGDYINLSYGSDGTAHMVWTDMSVFRPASSGYAQSTFYAKK